MDILIAILSLGSLGVLFAVSLTLASRKLAVKTDPRLDKLQELLPGSNCGACGSAGCIGFAESLLADKTVIDACRVCEQDAKQRIAGLLGRQLEKQVRKVAVLHCNGGSKVKDRFFYRGIEDCTAANLLLGGQKECIFGCLGFGTCEKVCPFGAIRMSDHGLPVVDEVKCKACNKCIEACPKKLFSLVPVSGKVYVACASLDSGREVKAACPVGCIACKLCERACKFDAIHVIGPSAEFTLSEAEALRVNLEGNRGVDNLAVIDYNKCTSCGECVKVCPTKCIRERD
ncbi:RnfABCDGE type electron transport complex subunit B [Candidatus Omnitrophota bacterium]